MMMKKTGTTQFWEPGFFSFTNELDREETRRLADLKTEMKAAGTQEQKDLIRKQIKETKSEFEQKRKAAKSSLFLRR
jgi:hypothetical protein